MRIRDLGYSPGLKPTGESNSILDVPGVGIGQVTLPTSKKAEDLARQTGKPCAKKGLTVILPRPADQAHIPCHAATHIFNGNGELTGRGQIADWGFINMPIVLTNSCSVGVCFDGAQDFMLDLHAKRGASALEVSRNYGTAVVGETADWWINSDLRDSKLTSDHVTECFAKVKTLADGGEVEEGSYGGGAGMTCHEYKGGTGTASRLVGGEDSNSTQYTLGVLVQTNYGHQIDMQIGGIPMGRIFAKEGSSASVDSRKKSDVAGGRTEAGSLLVIIITDAPLLPHQLDRLARHATVGTAQVGTYGVGRTFSGDIFLAVSTALHPKEQVEGDKVKIGRTVQTYQVDVVKNESIDTFFQAAAEATEEAILNSLVGGRDGMVGLDGGVIKGLPVERVKELLSQYSVPI